MWNERYKTSDYVFGTEPNEFLRSVVHRIPRGRILCIGEGEGRNSVYLAEQGFDVTAVDASAVGLDKANKLAESRSVHIETIVADLAEFEIKSESWDGIVSIFCHLPPAVRDSVHSKVRAGLKPGGVFVVEAYTPDQIPLGTGGPGDIRMMMSLSILHHDFDGFEFVHGVELQRSIIEGTFHTGRSAVVQGVLKK